MIRQINDPLSIRPHDIGFADVPLLRHRPIEDLRPRWDLVNFNWNAPANSLQRFAKTVSRDAPNDRQQLRDERMHSLARDHRDAPKKCRSPR